MSTAIERCTQCPHIEVSGDPDPYDSFCWDDVKARCAIANNTLALTTDSGRPIQAEPYITVSCRPYMLDRECKIPDWCPLKARNGKINTYERKVNRVKAIQFTNDTKDNVVKELLQCPEVLIVIPTGTNLGQEPGIRIKSKYGEPKHANSGDWVVIGCDGTVEVYSADEFERTFKHIQSGE